MIEKRTIAFLTIIASVVIISGFILGSKISNADDSVHAIQNERRKDSFTNCALITGNNATLMVPSDVTVISNSGYALEPGDEIAIYAPDGTVCGGVSTWDGSNMPITVWGDNDQTGEKDGLDSGEEMQFRIWDQSEGIEYTFVQVVYSQGDTFFAPDSIQIVDSLTVDGLSLGTIEGTVVLQGRGDHSGAEVCADDGSNLVCEQSDAGGAYSIDVAEGSHLVTVDMTRYLDAEKPNVPVAAGNITNLAPITILGGDSNDDCVINILDLSLMGGRFMTSCADPSWNPQADINNDCTVNILDLSVTGGNFGKSCPVPWD